MKKRKLLTKFAAGVMAVALCVTGLNTSLAAETAPDGSSIYNRSPKEIVLDNGTKPYPNGVYDSSASDPLFAATKFHVFAEDEASIQTHCNGNIATKYLYQQSNSGSNVVYDTQVPEVSYIRKLDERSNINFGPNTQVVFGVETNVYNLRDSEIYIDTYESATDTTPNVQKIETSAQADGTFRVFTEAADAGTDDSKRFINFDKEFEKLSRLSHNLAHESTTAGVKINENVIDLSGVSGTAYINVTPNDLMNRALIIDNTDFINNQALVINVDLGTLTDYTLPFTQVLFKEDGVSFGTGEDKGDYTGHGNVLWNFYGRDESGHVVNYTGKLTTCSEFKGTVLAPDADIWCASSNQDGNFIGKKVHLGGGQTHRWDFGGTLETYPDSYGSLQVTVTEDGSGNPIENVEIYIYEKGDENGDPVAKVVTGTNGKTVILDEIPVGKELTAIIKDIPYSFVIPTGDDGKPVDTKEKSIDSTSLHEIEFVLEKDTTAPTTPETGYIKVIVKDKDTGSYLEDIIVEVTDSTDSSIAGADPFVTDDFGTTYTQKLPISATPSENIYIVSIPDVPSGYKVPTNQIVELNANNSNPYEVIFELSKEEDNTPKGAIQIRVFEKNNPTVPIQNAIVSVNDSVGHVIKEVTVVTDKTGETEVVDGLPTTTNYVTELIGIPDGYRLDAGDSKTQSSIVVKENETTVVTYYLVKKEGAIKVQVVDENDNPISGVDAVITKDGAAVTGGSLTTGADGYSDPAEHLVIGDTYTATIDETTIPADYELVTTNPQTKKIEGEDVVTLTFVVKEKTPTPTPTGKLVVVVEKEDGTLVNDVDVDITNGATPVESLTTGSEGTDGTTAVCDDLTIGETYTATLDETTIPTGYELDTDNPQTKKIVDEELATITFVIKETPVTPPTPTPTGKLVVVVEKEDGTLVNDVDVDITNGATPVESLTTGSEGTDGTTAVCDDLTIGETYTATLDETTIPTGYELDTDNPQTKKIVDEELATITFVIKETPVTPPTPTPTGKLVVVVKKEDGTLVNDVDVDITNGTTPVESLTTGSAGTDGTTAVCDDLTIGETYTATVDETTIPTGYELDTDNPQTKKIVDEDLATITFVIKEKQTVTPPTPETGDLQVTIVDKNDPTKPIPGATVQIKDKDGNVVAEGDTDENGKTDVFKDLPVGDYTVHVSEMPEDSEYTAPGDQETEVKANELKEEKLVVEVTPEVTPEPTPEPTPTPETGEIDIVITDKNTGDPIPGATVVVKDKDGNIVDTVVTDSNGKTPVVDELTVGETYTIETTDVPDGYTAPEPTTQKITSPEKVTVPLETGRDSGVTSSTGSLYVIITDKNTGDPIPGATVEVSNSAGEVVETVITDATGSFTVTNLKPDTYTVTTTKVPSGYTAPDPQSSAVKSNARTDVHLYVAKGTTTQNTPNTDTVVQTGDDSHVQMAGIMAMLAFLGIVVITIMKKREEI